MLPSIRTILDLAIVQTAEPVVLSGRDHLQRDVRWVHVSETRDMTGLLRGGEMVLGTGLAIGHGVDAITAYLSDLERAGAVALLVELTTALEQQATDLRIAAGAVTLPVITVARRVRFVEITETVHRMIVADQLGKLERARGVHEIFTTLSLESAGAADIVRRAAELIDAPVVLEDLAHLVVAHSAQGRSAPDLLLDWEGRSRATHLRDRTERAGPEAWLQTPVGTRTQRWGRLIVPVLTGDDDDARMILERASQALSINRLAEKDRWELSHQAQAGLLHELRQPHTISLPDVQARAQALGLKAASAYAPVVICVEEGPGETTDALASLHEDRVILEAVAFAVRVGRSSALEATLQAGTIGVVLAIPDGATEDALLERFCRALNDRLSGIRVVVGVSASRANLIDAAAGLDEALHVARTAATLPGDRKAWYRSSDVRLRGLLALLRDDPRAQVFAESELAGILGSHGTADLALLRRFLNSGGNKAALARTGYVSRPTLYARLARLEEQLGVDLADAESRTSLHVAVLLHDLRLLR